MLALPKLKMHISSKVKTVDFIDYQKKFKEKTSSSILGLHFSHCKNAAESNIMSKLYTTFLDTTIKTGAITKRWTKGLSVMLEKY